MALSEDDLIDIIVDALSKKKATAQAGSAAGERPTPDDWRSAGRPAVPGAERSVGKWGFHVQKPFNPSWTSMPMKRPFVSEYMAKQLAEKEKAQKRIRIPKAAILSPLAEEWLQTRGISVVRE